MSWHVGSRLAVLVGLVLSAAADWTVGIVLALALLTYGLCVAEDLWDCWNR